jgi:pimeloyl-ACP methyl ester carboxylesterase
MPHAGDCGAEIDCFPIDERAFLASKGKGVELVVIEDSRHGIPADQPMKFNNILSDFIAETG